MCLCVFALNKCKVFLAFVCCGGVFHDDSSPFFWQNSTDKYPWAGRLTLSHTDRAEVLKTRHWERGSQGQRSVVWYGLNFALLKLCSGQIKETTATDTKQANVFALDIARVEIYILQKKCFLWSAQTEYNRIQVKLWAVDCDPLAGRDASTRLWGKPCWGAFWPNRDGCIQACAPQCFLLIVLLLIAGHLRCGSMTMILVYSFRLSPPPPSTYPVFVVATFFAVCTLSAQCVPATNTVQVYLATRMTLMLFLTTSILSINRLQFINMGTKPQQDGLLTRLALI